MLKCVTYIAGRFISAYLEDLYKEKNMPDSLKDKVKELKKVDEKEETTTGNRTCNVAGEI